MSIDEFPMLYPTTRDAVTAMLCHCGKESSVTTQQEGFHTERIDTLQS